jgi:hypothetical protein
LNRALGAHGAVASNIVSCRSYDVTNTNLLDFGSVSGDSMTGVRLSLSGIVTLTAIPSQIGLMPNGLSSLFSQWQAERVAWDNIGGIAVRDQINSGALTGLTVGLAVWSSDWVTVGGRIQASAHGTLFTKSDNNPGRMYIGEYINSDFQTDLSRTLNGRMGSHWQAGTTQITALKMVVINGNFSGRVALETIP